MTDLILPPGITSIAGAVSAVVAEAEAKAKAEADDGAKLLPTPSGYKLLCAVPDVKDTFDDSDILKADSAKRAEEHGTTVLFVMRVGPDAYKDKDKFTSGPWCKEGDFVITRTYAGTRIKIFGKEFRIINDDQVEATVDDPRGITRAY
jgi:co-chaperonin GroES (HSP10)